MTQIFYPLGPLAGASSLLLAVSPQKARCDTGRGVQRAAGGTADALAKSF